MGVPRVARRAIGIVAVVFVFAVPPSLAAEPVFESGPSRPLALSPDGSRLYAVNTPDHRLEIFDVLATGLRRAGSVPVGLEPVAVAVRSASEVWVVNHLSDSVSVVDVASVPPRVTRTLLVGDEPGDIVFAGPARARAFVTAAHRGQNRPGDPQLQTAGVGRADVWVFDADHLGGDLGGLPLAILPLFGDTPRALAVSPDGATVYAAIYRSGNKTTVVPQGQIPSGSMPPPATNVDGVAAPPTSLIVRNDGSHWRDGLGRSWDDAIRFALPDKDVFAIDATATPPRASASWSGVGTVLYAMAVNPVSGRVYVANTEARNDVRFEGSGAYGGSTVRGHVVDDRVTVVDPTGVKPRNLNAHIRYDDAAGAHLERLRSVSQPMGMAVTKDGGTMYLAAFGSQKVAIVPTAALEAGTYVAGSAGSIPIPGGGVSGLALDEARGRLYVASRFDNAVTTVRLSDRATLDRAVLHTAEPPEIVAGRKKFYDGVGSSAHGDASCASCHVFGDEDGLAWDLGNPDGKVVPNPNPFRFPASFTPPPFHPMKGPMTTQTLRSLSGHGPLHWRGDRTGGDVPGGDPMDTRAALMRFAGAFDGLLGRSQAMDAPTMDEIADFILALTAPPNPIRNLDNSLSAAQTRGRDLFNNFRSTGAGACSACHALDPSQDEYGADGMSSFDGFPQMFKIAELRAVYTKVGMFGMAEDSLFRPGDNGFKGDQIRGFGFSFDGSVDTLTRFLSARVFNFPLGDSQRRDVAEFVAAFDADMAPIVGQQVTRSAATAAVVDPRIDLLLARAAVVSPRRECDVVVHGVVAGRARGWVRLAGGTFRSDSASEGPWSDASLRALANVPGQELTYTAVPPDTGLRLGIDRDLDGYLDADECAPDDAGAFALPGETVGLKLARASSVTTLTWTSAAAGAGPGIAYDVASGDLAALRSDRGFGRAVCAASGVPDGPWVDATPDPAAGRGVWYLVRARNACGAGPYGDARSISTCP